MSCSNIHLQVQLETRTTGLVWGGYTAATIGDIYLLRKPPYYSHSRTFTWQWNRPRQNHLKCGFSMFFLLYFERYQSDLPGNFETCLAIPWVFLSSGRFFMDFSAETVNRYEPPERRRWNSR